MTSTFNSVLPTHWSDQLLLQYWCSFLTFIIAFPKYWWTIKYWYRHINQLMLWIFMGQNKNFSNNLCYHFLQMLDLVTYCFSKVVSRKVIYGLCYIWKQSCKVFWYTCANLTNQHFLKHQLVTYMCVCVCVCVCLCLFTLKASSVSNCSNVKEQINDIVLKTFLFSAKFLHHYFRMKHQAFLTSHFILFTLVVALVEIS